MKSYIRYGLLLLLFTGTSALAGSLNEVIVGQWELADSRINFEKTEIFKQDGSYEAMGVEPWDKNTQADVTRKGQWKVISDKLIIKYSLTMKNRKTGETFDSGVIENSRVISKIDADKLMYYSELALGEMVATYLDRVGMSTQVSNTKVKLKNNKLINSTVNNSNSSNINKRQKLWSTHDSAVGIDQKIGHGGNSAFNLFKDKASILLNEKCEMEGWSGIEKRTIQHFAKCSSSSGQTNYRCSGSARGICYKYGVDDANTLTAIPDVLPADDPDCSEGCNTRGY